MRSSTPGIFLLTCLFLVLFPAAGHTQLLAGPMPGYVELRTARIWAELTPGNSGTCWYWKAGDPGSARRVEVQTNASDWYSPVTFDLVDLSPNSSYEYAVSVNDRSGKRPSIPSGSFQTQSLWQWRQPAPDFSFLTGSCAYFNEPAFDRPGKPYGQDSSIFETMAGEKAAFMVWLGDNWYTREADFFSRWGLWYRAHRDRGLPVLQPFLHSMPQYAIWDDHDYGPNDADRSYIYRDESLRLFKSYWPNPSYGEDGAGIYTKLSYSDCDFFLMDDRYFRDADNMAPYVNGKANPGKHMWGNQQMSWLKDALLQSHASFKFIVTGSQTLNPLSPYDCLQHYPAEFEELMQFLANENIRGVLFLTGDRHHSEVIRYPRSGQYSLYDITSSPLTSGVAGVSGKEKENPFRVPGTLVEAQNYTRIGVSGERGNRELLVTFVGLKGEELAHWRISEKELGSK